MLNGIKKNARDKAIEGGNNSHKAFLIGFRIMENSVQEPFP